MLPLVNLYFSLYQNDLINGLDLVVIIRQDVVSVTTLDKTPFI